MSRLLEVSDLTVTFPTETEEVPAVRGLNFHVDAGEVLALVGESGAGKSASAMSVMGSVVSLSNCLAKSRRRVPCTCCGVTPSVSTKRSISIDLPRPTPPHR